MNFKILWILSIYTIWDGLSLKTISRYCPFKFMHNYIHRKLPLSFHETWTSNLNRNPNRQLRNANDLFIPAHHFATVKRFPLYTFPPVWNEESDRKFIFSHLVYFKQLKAALLENIVN
jgi:hypothetical protein